MAEADIQTLVLDLSDVSVNGAMRVYAEIRKQVSLLEEYPLIGRAGRVRGTRELVLSRTDYIAVYRVLEEGVYILRVLHGARRWPKRV